MATKDEPTVGEISAPAEIEEETAADLPTLDRDLMALHQSDALSREATHEYLHMVMQHVSAALPACSHSSRSTCQTSAVPAT